jgi:hypothetical protein
LVIQLYSSLSSLPPDLESYSKLYPSPLYLTLTLGKSIFSLFNLVTASMCAFLRAPLLNLETCPSGEMLE